MMHEIDFRSDQGTSYIRLVWLSDLHLDFIHKKEYKQLLEMILEVDPNLILIGGDIFNGENGLKHLLNLEHLLAKPIYFVLGNHDFYYGSIQAIRAQAKELTAVSPNLHYLTGGGVFQLTASTALIGHDGWADALAGDFMKSTVELNDYYLIEDLKRLTKEEKLIKLNEFGKQTAETVSKTLEKALATYQKVLFLTHVPPFIEACVHKGIQSDWNWSPHFVGHATGEIVKKIMENHPDKELLILCGHTHSSVDVKILPNLRVVAGQSDYGIPSIQGLIFS